MFGRYLLLALLFAASPALAMTGSVAQTNLTSDGSVPAPNFDPNLKNPWGVSYAPTGPFWVSDNATGLSTLYDGTGAPQSLVVTVPAAKAGGTGVPTGQAYNPTANFVISRNGASGPAVFIFATEDGTISGWVPSVNANTALIAVNRSAQQAVYKGLAMVASPGGKMFLLATDFHNGMVDVFDDRFKMLGSFRDTTLPRNYSPYNVAVLDGNIFITYAQVDATRHDSVSGPGKGAVEQVTLSGMVLRRFMHGTLNAPWGLALVPASGGAAAGDLLVGNFGDGRISVFTPLLQPRGVVMNASGAALSIDGLWALIPGNGGSAGDPDAIYFTAGPNDEQNGLFGKLTVAP